jgi:Holliday junction resolvase
MAQTPEGKVKAAVRKLLVEFGVYYFSPAANGFGRAGIPDIICCFGGRFIAIECKAGKGKTTALQDRELAAIRTAGGMTMVVNETNIDELKEKLQWMR